MELLLQRKSKQQQQTASMKLLLIVLLALFLAICHANKTAQELKDELNQIAAVMKQQVQTRSASNSRFEQLAEHRKELLKELIQTDPDSASEHVLTSEQRTAEFGAQAADSNLFEEAVHVDSATLNVIITMLTPQEQEHSGMSSQVDDHPMSSLVERYVDFEDGNTTRHFKAFACQGANEVQSHQAVNITGYAVDDVFLLQEAEPHRRRTRQMAASWTTGSKSLLFIRVDFNDFAGEPITNAAATTLLNSVKTYWSESSYNQLNLASWSITPTIRLSQSGSFYGVNYLQLMNDARSAAAAAGFNVANFNLHVVYFARIAAGWSGRGYVGTAGMFKLRSQ